MQAKGGSGKSEGANMDLESAPKPVGMGLRAALHTAQPAIGIAGRAGRTALQNSAASFYICSYTQREERKDDV